MDKGQHTGMILIDLQKAFDTLDHDILLKKMECLGFKKVLSSEKTLYKLKIQRKTVARKNSRFCCLKWSKISKLRKFVSLWNKIVNINKTEGVKSLTSTAIRFWSDSPSLIEQWTYIIDLRRTSLPPLKKNDVWNFSQKLHQGDQHSYAIAYLFN